MNAVMWSDFITCKQMLKSQLLISGIIALAVSLPTGTVNVVCPTVAVSMAVSTAVSVVALDERNGWEGFRACMPLSRADIMRGRMGFIALVSVAAVLMGLLLSFVISAVMQVAGTSLGIDPAGFAISGLDLLLTVCATLCVLALSVGVTMPMVARYGMSNAIRFVGLVWVALFLVAFIAIDKSPAGPALAEGLDALISGSPALACLCALLVAALIYAASAAISTKLYQKREF
ncbi:MAG: ABC-2 transporter permease [Coriobacteriales bacterium]